MEIIEIKKTKILNFCIQNNSIDGNIELLLSIFKNNFDN